MTNWRKYFGTVGRAALTTVEPYVDAMTGAQMIRLTQEGREVMVLKARYFGVWLKWIGERIEAVEESMKGVA